MSTTIDTGNHVRFERVTSVIETERGLLAELHGEQLRIDLIRDDVVRFKISRGGVFDESPTFAVCVDPLADACSSPRSGTWRGPAAQPRQWSVTLGLDPFRLDVHRADGSAVVETAHGRRRSVLDVRDAERRVHRPPSVPSGGCHLRARREDRPPQPQGSRLHAVEHGRAQSRREPPSSPPARPPTIRAADRTSTEFDPYYVSIPFFYHQTYPARCDGGVVRGQRLSRRATSSARRGVPHSVHGGQYTEYVFAGPGMPRSSARTRG